MKVKTFLNKTYIQSQHIYVDSTLHLFTVPEDVKEKTIKSIVVQDNGVVCIETKEKKKENSRTIPILFP